MTNNAIQPYEKGEGLLPGMVDCLFCKIAAGEIKALVIYKDQGALGILDIHPRSLGHTMVIPREHAETIIDLPGGQLGDLFRAVAAVTALLKDRLRPDGFTIGINHGKASGQTMDHLHVHVIPRWKGDGGASLHGVVSPPEGIARTLDEVHRKIVQQ